MSIPPALLLILWVFILVCRADERDAKVALLPIHGNLLLPGRNRRSWVLLSWNDITIKFESVYKQDKIEYYKENREYRF